MDKNRYYCDLLDACYHRDENMIKSLMNLDDCKMLQDKDTDTEVYMCKNSNELYVVCTGVEKNKKDILSVFDWFPCKIGSGEYVHRGFFKKFKAILPKVREYFYYNITDIEVVIFIGHSAGGFISRMLCDYFDSILRSRVNFVWSWDISTPACMSKKINERIIGSHFVNSSDYVRFLPTWLLGYRFPKKTVVLKNKKFKPFKYHYPEYYFREGL